MELNEISEIPRTVPVYFGAEKITLQCDFGAFTPVFCQKIASMTEWDDAIRFLLTAARGWDVTQNGKPCPLTKEVLENLPSAIVQKMLAAVVSDYTEQCGGQPSCMRSLLED
jgi:hypothetical protein